MTNILGLAILWGGLLGFIVFLIGYWVKSGGACWRHPVGRWLIASKATMAGIFVLSLITRYFGRDWPGRELLFLGISIAYVIQIWWLVWLLAIASPGKSLGDQEQEKEKDYDLRS